jgi:hypothetical protein
MLCILISTLLLHTPFFYFLVQLNYESDDVSETGNNATVPVVESEIQMEDAFSNVDDGSIFSSDDEIPTLPAIEYATYPPSIPQADDTQQVIDRATEAESLVQGAVDEGRRLLTEADLQRDRVSKRDITVSEAEDKKKNRLQQMEKEMREREERKKKNKSK